MDRRTVQRRHELPEAGVLGGVRVGRVPVVGVLGAVEAAPDQTLVMRSLPVASRSLASPAMRNR
ncbi:hypothetical protein D3C59_34245 [Streptomyces sp. SHP22-7]|nr:hypothetical protein D3C59_34245 [Streptomyces sp. SHP22-7]